MQAKVSTGRVERSLILPNLKSISMRTLYSLFAVSLTALLLTGCNPTPTDKAKYNVDKAKDAKVNQIDAKADADKQKVKNDAKLTQDAIDAQAAANKASNVNAVENEKARADALREEAKKAEQRADDLNKN